MKLAIQPASHADLETVIKSRFAEFNRRSSPSQGRRYPSDLRDLLCQGSLSGLSNSELRRLSGMSPTSIKATLANVKPVCARRLEVIPSAPLEEAARIPLTIRLSSGVRIEIPEVGMLTAELLINLSKLEVSHAASC